MSDIFARIRRRLVGWNLLVLAGILVFLGWAVYAVLSNILLVEVDRNLAARTEAVASRLERSDRDERLRLDDEDSYVGGLFYLLIGPGGQVLANPQRVNLSGGLSQLSAGRSPHYESINIGDEPVRLYVRPLFQGRRGEVALATGQSVRPQMDALNGLVLVLLAGGTAGLALSLVGAWFLAGRALVPIQDAFRRQQQFVADASHELRTPLTVLHAATDILDRHRAEPLEANGQLLDDIRREITRMERLVADLLTLARSDMGEVELATGPVDLSVLAGDAVRLMGTLARENGIHLAVQGEERPLVVNGDPDRLQQVLLILLDNALKHTPSGGNVTVASGRKGSNAWLEVRDSGKGIPPEHLPRVFDRFYRADAARSRDQGSSGLGLAIARSLIEAHRGQLGLSSSPGVGTVATIYLPADRAPSKPAQERPAAEPGSQSP